MSDTASDTPSWKAEWSQEMLEAIGFHEAGDLISAERIYRRALDLALNHKSEAGFESAIKTVIDHLSMLLWEEERGEEVDELKVISKNVEPQIELPSVLSKFRKPNYAGIFEKCYEAAIRTSFDPDLFESLVSELNETGSVVTTISCLCQLRRIYQIERKRKIVEIIDDSIITALLPKSSLGSTDQHRVPLELTTEARRFPAGRGPEAQNPNVPRDVVKTVNEAFQNHWNNFESRIGEVYFSCLIDKDNVLRLSRIERIPFVESKIQALHQMIMASITPWCEATVELVSRKGELKEMADRLPSKFTVGVVDDLIFDANYPFTKRD